MPSVFATLVCEFDRKEVERWATERKWSSDRSPEFAHIEKRYKEIWALVKAAEAPTSSSCCSRRA